MRVLAGFWIALLVGGCGTGISIDVGIGPRISGPAPPFEDCEAEAYAFIGETSLAALGLDKATRAEVPDAERVGMIWVTADTVPFDVGPPGGPLEMARSFCAEFPDGSGLSGWPIDETWELPTEFGGVPMDRPLQPLNPLVLLIGAAIIIVASVLAFRQRKA